MKPSAPDPTRSAAVPEILRSEFSPLSSENPIFEVMKIATHSAEAIKSREEACAAKQRYHNSQEAHTAIHGLVSRPGRKKQKNLRTYHCTNCGGWHLTSQ